VSASGAPGRPRVVAIDGTAGSGKSTVARSLAGVLGLPYVNTGLMYRALAAAALRAGVAPDDERGLLELATRLRFIVEPGPPGALEVEGYGEEALTSVDVESTVSTVAAHPAVRAHMRREQRALGTAHGAVMEGRDIASVVFPDAPVQLYLQARPDVRARRRADERARRPADVAAALEERDERDSRTNPHEPTPEAVVIDTTDLDRAATLEAALDVVRRRAPELMP
jgi:CMP/dCMP kinase